MGVPKLKLVSNRDVTEEDRSEEALALLKEKLSFVFGKKPGKSKAAFIKLLKESGIEAKEYMTLVLDVARDINGFEKWVVRQASIYQFTTLKDVTSSRGSTFLKILMIVEKEYASDVAHLLPFQKASMLVVEEVLLHP